MSKHLPRGTVTFLFTDIEGSTRLWETHPKTMPFALTRHDAILSQSIEAFGGRIFKTGGDAFCAAFDSAPNALQAALAAQRKLLAELWPAPIDIRVRMGMHTGKAELRNGDYYGLTLSRVARLLSLAHGRQTLLTEATRSLCRKYLPPHVSLKPLGEYHLKDFEQFEAVFQLCHPDLQQVFPPLKTLLAPIDDETPSIAVLPFEDISRERQNQYFADGLADELLNLLSRMRGLRVASRTSAFSFKGKSIDISTIARMLNVATVLEGSVRIDGKRVRIAAQLVHVATDSHMWSDVYDRELEDIFAVQDDIARAVVNELRRKLFHDRPQSSLSRSDIATLVKGRTESAEAYRLCLQGRFFADRMTRKDMTRAVQDLSRAVELEPGYALAWARLARAYLLQAGYSWAPLEEGFDRARAAANRAVELQRDLSEAHVALGLVQMNFDWDWQRADTSFRSALELAPGSTEAISGAAIMAGALGRHEEAVALAQRAVLLDPLSMAAHRTLGARLLHAGLYSEAETVIAKAIELNPQGGLLHCWLGRVYLLQERLSDARHAFEREVIEYYHVQGRALVEHSGGSRSESEAALRELIEHFADESAYQIAEVYAYRKEFDSAFLWLERAHVQRDPGLSGVKSNPLLNNLHDDARWLLFLRKMSLAD